MPRGRLKRETNPAPREKAGLTPQHDSSGQGDFVNTSPINPLPTKDVDVKAELEAIKQTQSEILTRLDGTFDTQVIGSNVQKNYLENIPLPAGSFVSTDTLIIEGTRIGVGIRFTNPLKFEVRASPKIAGTGTSVDSSRNHTIIETEQTSLTQSVGSYSLYTRYNSFSIFNNGDNDTNVIALTITDFMASNGVSK